MWKSSTDWLFQSYHRILRLLHESLKNLLPAKTGSPGLIIKRTVCNFYNKCPFLMQGHHCGPERKFLMRQNLETMLIYTWWSCNLWTRLSLPFGEQDDNLASKCFLLLRQRGLIALLALAHKVTRNTYPPWPGASGESNGTKQKEGFGNNSQPLLRWVFTRTVVFSHCFSLQDFIYIYFRFSCWEHR